MQFDKAAGANPIDQEKAIGQPTPRIEGPLKVTGRAPYAYERRLSGAASPAYGFVLGAAIAKGNIKSIDLAEAQAAPGVLAIVTADSQPPLGKGQFNHAPLLAGPDAAAGPTSSSRFNTLPDKDFSTVIAKCPSEIAYLL